MSFTWLSKIVRKPTTTRRRPVGRHRPRLELLEDRTVPAFFTSPTFAVGSVPVGAAVGDFNGDGKSDIAVVNQGSNTVSVLLGNGNGTFAPKTDYATGTTPVGVAVGAFNGDGKLDLAVVNQVAHSISILLGNGDGTFLAKTDVPLPLAPYALTVGDFNGDGKADIAVTTQNSTVSAPTDDVTLLLGNGNGTFQAPVNIVADSFAAFQNVNAGGHSSIQTADLNGDGRLDLVVVNNKDTWALVGRAQSRTTFPAAGTVSVLLGNGDGTFQAPRIFAVGVGANSVAVGDFNGDGHPDFAVSNNNSTFVNVFTNTGVGNFTSATLNIGTVPSSTLAAGDFNGDGASDLTFTVGTFAGFGAFISQKVYYGQVGGTLQATAPTYVEGLTFPVVGDFNGDGHPDLAGGASNATVSTWLNNGTGTFSAPSLISAAGVTFSSQATGDFNGDGIPDVVTNTGQVQLGLGDGRFGDTTTLTLPATPFGTTDTVAALDADGNGTIDVLISNNNIFGTGQAGVWFNSPGYDNRTGGAVSFTVSAPTQIAAGDNGSVTVTAVDALGNPVPGFLGTVDLDFTPAGSTALNLAGQYTFTAADNGRHTFLFSNVTQVGAGALSVFAAGMPTAAAPLNVVPAALNKFVFAVPTSIPAGSPFSFTITAEDRFGNVEAGYAGTVHFSAVTNDTQAVLPADYTFTATDAGTHTFTATLTKTAGAFIAATDVATSVHSSANIGVTPLAAVGLSMSLAATTPVRIPVSVVVSAVDQFGNVATGYTGTIHFASTDPQAQLPADYTFTAADAGSHMFTATLNTTGTQTLSVTDTASPTLSSQAQISLIVVVPASFELFASPTATAGVAQSYVLLALDALGNVLTGYTGTVHFTSSDVQAVLPADATFTAADRGILNFTATLKTAGTQSISVLDTAHPSINTSVSVSVAPGAVTHFIISGPTTVTQGVGFKITVSAVDDFGNVNPGYRGAVHLSSTDSTGGTQNFTFSNNDNGVHIFSYTFNALGLQTITVVDSTNGSIIGSIVVDVLKKP
jgi:trimeric autotransporter adhesin